MPYPGLLYPDSLSLQQSTADPYLHRRHSNTGQHSNSKKLKHKTRKLRLYGVSGSWCKQGLFECFEHLGRVWGFILNVISPLVPSFWGFSFALGSGVSPQNLSSTMQMQLQCQLPRHSLPSSSTLTQFRDMHARPAPDPLSGG